MAALVSCATGEQVDEQHGTIVIIGSGGTAPDASDGTEDGGSPAMGGASPAPLGSGGTGAAGPLASGGNPSSSTGGRATGAGGQSGPSSGGVAGAGAGGRAGAAGSSAAGGAQGGAAGTVGNGGATSGSGGAANCSTTEKICGGVCTPKSPANGCSATRCSACDAAPANGVQSCNAQGDCDFDCLTGFQKNGNRCSRVAGAGGAAGASGAGGSGGSVVCNNDTCRTCPGDQVTCCDRVLGLCLCALQNLASALCK